jgi:hypothetical protein
MNRVPRWLPWALIGVFFALAILFNGQQLGSGPVVTEVPYSQFKKLVDEGAVAAVTFRGEDARARLKTGP